MASNNPQAVFDKAMAALESGDHQKAARLARKLTKMAPDAADAWQLRAMAAQQADAHREAERYWRKTLQLRPGDAAILNNLGNACREQGNFPEARSAYELSLERRPEHVPTLLNLGDVCLKQNDLVNSLGAYRRAAELNPADRETLSALAYAEMEAEEFAAALKTYRRLEALGNPDAEVMYGIFHAAVTLGQIQEGQAAVDRMLELSGGDPKYEVNASILHLLKGQWREGWKAYARRWEWQPDQARPYTQPCWQGEALNGRTLLVWGEQGIGDEIMYASMVGDLPDKAGRIVLECDPRLIRLFSAAFPDVTCVSRTDPPDPAALSADLQIPAPALGQWLRTDEESFRKGPPFLAAEADRAADIRETYRQRFGGRALIGLSWKSLNAEYGTRKSMPLEALSPLLDLPGAAFVDLQYGDTQAERAAFAEKTGLALYHDPNIDPIADIDGHAAQIAALDLVITISNSTAHLAAAMGVPTWVLLTEVPDRRWLMERDDSPWYRAVRLFRQSSARDWQSVVAEVRSRLPGFIEKLEAKA